MEYLLIILSFALWSACIIAGFMMDCLCTPSCEDAPTLCYSVLGVVIGGTITILLIEYGWRIKRDRRIDKCGCIWPGNTPRM